MTTDQSGARQRLAAVDGLLVASADPRMAARASIWLLRLAVEHALDDLWTRCAPDLVQASRRAQLLVLRSYLDDEDAWQVAELWNVLSRVAHHHAYELTPTRAEIRVWRAGVKRSIAVLTSAERPKSGASMPVAHSDPRRTI